MARHALLILLWALAAPASVLAGPVLVVDEQRGRGLARMRGDECFVLTAGHVISSTSRRPGEDIEIIGPDGARGQAVFTGTVGDEKKDDVAMLRVITNVAAVCDDPEIQRLKGIDEPTLVLRESSGSLSFVPVALSRTDRRAIEIRSSSELRKMMSGALLVDAGQEQGILIKAKAKERGIGEVRSLEYIAGLLGAWVKGSAGNLMVVGDTLEVLRRAVETKPTGDIGQVAAAEQHAREGLAFDGMALEGIFLNGAALPDSRFMEARLHGASFVRAGLAGASFTNAAMPFADLTGAQAPDAEFTGAFLPYVDAAGVILENADLSQSNWFAARMQGANLSGAKLVGASLAFADLRKANLRGADLTHSVLYGAVFDGAQLEGAIFDNTDISSASGISINVSLKAPLVCARKARGYVRPEIMEMRPSTRFDGGIAYDRIRTGDSNYFNVPGGSSLFNEICAEVPEALRTKVKSPIYGNEHISEMTIGLPSELLDTGDRRQKYIARMRAQAEFLNAEARAEDFLRTGSKRMDAIVSQLRDAEGANVVRPHLDCFDDDSFALLASTFTPSLTDEEWSVLATSRLTHESMGREPTSSMRAGESLEAVLPWGLLFPVDFNSSDIGPRIVEIFRAWNEKRAKAQDGRITFCLGGTRSPLHLNKRKGWAQAGRTPEVDGHLRALGFEPEHLVVLMMGSGGVFGERVAFVLEDPLHESILESVGTSARGGNSEIDRREIQIQVAGLEHFELQTEPYREALVVVRGRVVEQ